jgi:tripeptide aminopeptidase
MINNTRLKETFLDMVHIASPSRRERKMADYVTRALTELGAEVTEDKAGEKIGGDAGNVIARFRGNADGVPTILFSSHMDTVTPCDDINVIEEDGILRTDGKTILGGDDKAGIAAILEALRVVKEKNIAHGDIEVVFAIAEEAGLLGSKNLDRDHVRAEMGFIFDSSGKPGEAIVKAPASNSMRMTVHGKKSHAGLAPERGINAITLASRAIAEAEQGRIDDETTANIGVIKGGTATNIVPDLVEVWAEARSHSEEKLERATEALLAPFRKIADGGTCDIEVIREYDAYSLDEREPVVQVVCDACARIGLTADLVATGGGSDGNNFNKLGLPSVVLGIGMTDVHTTAESIRVIDIENSARLALAIIESAAQEK